jgi:hypothetical protein
MNIESSLIIVTCLGVVGWILAIAQGQRYRTLQRFLLDYMDAVHLEHELWKQACIALIVGDIREWLTLLKRLQDATNSTTPPSTASEEGNSESDLESNTTAGGVRSGVPGNGI